MSRINYKHLYYFWVIAKQGSIARASEVLHLTPPTLSSQISVLEANLNVKLFDKKGRRLVLSDAGEEAFGYADEIFSLGNELESFLANGGVQRQTTFRVGVADVMPKLLIYQFLAPIIAVNQDVKLVCLESTFEALLANLASHSIDLLIADRRVSPDSNMRVYNHSLGSSGVTFFSQKVHSKALAKAFPQSLDNCRVLLPTLNTALRRSLEHWFEECQISPIVAGEFDDSALLKVFGQAGLGVFCAPSVIENEIIRQYEVAIVGRTDAINEKFYAITAERRIINPLVAQVRDQASEILVQ